MHTTMSTTAVCIRVFFFVFTRTARTWVSEDFCQATEISHNREEEKKNSVRVAGCLRCVPSIYSIIYIFVGTRNPLASYVAHIHTNGEYFYSQLGIRSNVSRICAALWSLWATRHTRHTLTVSNRTVMCVWHICFRMHRLTLTGECCCSRTVDVYGALTICCWCLKW